MALAGVITRPAMPGGATPQETPMTPAEAAEAAKGFDRAARAVRQSIALQARILDQRRARQERREAARAAEAAEAEAVLADRRLTGRLRRSMAHFIAQTAIEAQEREPEEVERLMEGLDARLAGGDDADFDQIHVKNTAFAICQDLGVDPGAEWWMEGWGISSDPSPARGRMGPVPKEREDGVTKADRQSTAADTPAPIRDHLNGASASPAGPP